MKLILQIIGLIIVLLGSIAVPVYQHTCVHDKVVMKSAFVKVNHCLDEKKNQHNHEKPCCEEPKKAKDCCEDEVSSFQIPFYQWQTDHFSFVQVAILEEPTLSVVTTDFLLFRQNPILAFSDLPPPKLPKRLALLQVWRI